MPAIAAMTVKPEISTARPEVAAAMSSASVRRAPRAALLALAAQVEQRVVDADGHADEQDDRGDRVVERDDWLGSATSPSVANTAESASSSGMPAAASAPNARIRIEIVIGSDSFSAFLKSSSNALSSALLALAPPNSPMRTLGLPRADAVDGGLDRVDRASR